MTREELRVDGLPEPLSHYTDAVRAGDLLFVSGVVPVDASGALVGGDDVVAQAEQVFRLIGLVLEAAGATAADVVKVTVFLLNKLDRERINPVRRSFFGEARPASTLVEVSGLVVPGARLEVEAVALLSRTEGRYEFAWGVTGQNAHGDVVNPRHPDRIAGGSSAGNAAALAAELVPLALGTDTGGSVRMPAAACGVVGLKPALGAVSTQGVFPLAPSFDTVGPMARTVADGALAHAILTGAVVPAPRLAGLRIGVLGGPPAPDERAQALAEVLRALGGEVREVALPRPRADTWPVFCRARCHRDRGP